MSVASIIVYAIDQVMYIGSIQFPNEKVNFYAYDENAQDCEYDSSCLHAFTSVVPQVPKIVVRLILSRKTRIGLQNTEFYCAILLVAYDVLNENCSLHGFLFEREQPTQLCILVFYFQVQTRKSFVVNLFIAQILLIQLDIRVQKRILSDWEVVLLHVLWEFLDPWKHSFFVKLYIILYLNLFSNINQSVYFVLLVYNLLFKNSDFEQKFF